MKTYSLETLLNYLFLDLEFSSRILVLGGFEYWEDAVEPNTRVKIFFYLERMVKKDIARIGKFNNTVLLENIVLETHALPIAEYKEKCGNEKEGEQMEEVRMGEDYYTILRNDFTGSWYLRRDQIITLLDYLLCQLRLPRECAVLAFNCFKFRRGIYGKGIWVWGKMELLFVFEKIKNPVVREVKKLEGVKLHQEVKIHVNYMDKEDYEKFLAGESIFHDTMKITPDSILTLYDFFHRKRLKAPFIKKIV